MHVHTGPELLQRRYDPMTLAEEARGASTAPIRSYASSTSPPTAWTKS
jgi:hypothetical protein